MSTLPLAAVSSVLTALDADKEDVQLGPKGARALDTAGYESVSHTSPVAFTTEYRLSDADGQDGGEELEVSKPDDDSVAGWVWKFNKSPLGMSFHFIPARQSM